MMVLLTIDRSSISFDSFDVFLKFTPGAHDLMAAAEAAKAKIRADAQNLPALFAAGMRLFHGENVSDANVHSITP